MKVSPLPPSPHYNRKPPAKKAKKVQLRENPTKSQVKRYTAQIPGYVPPPPAPSNDSDFVAGLLVGAAIESVIDSSSSSSSDSGTSSGSDFSSGGGGDFSGGGASGDF